MEIQSTSVHKENINAEKIIRSNDGIAYDISRLPSSSCHQQSSGTAFTTSHSSTSSATRAKDPHGLITYKEGEEATSFQLNYVPARLETHETALTNFADRQNQQHASNMPATSTDLGLMSLLGASTAVSRSNIEKQHKVDRARSKEIAYLAQFPSLKETDPHFLNEMKRYKEQLEA